MGVDRYLSLFAIYTPYTIYRCMLLILDIMQKLSLCKAVDGFDGWLKVIYARGWKCMFAYFDFVLGAFLTLSRHNLGSL